MFFLAKPILTPGAFVAGALFISPAAAETLRLNIESGAITGITTKGSGFLSLYLTVPSGDDFTRFTIRHQRKVIDVMIGGKLYASPRIMDPLYSHVIPISTPLSDTERREIIEKQNALHVIPQNNIRYPDSGDDQNLVSFRSAARREAVTWRVCPPGLSVII